MYSTYKKLQKYSRLNNLINYTYKDTRNAASLCLQDGPWLHENLHFEAYPGKKMRVGTCNKKERNSKKEQVKTPRRWFPVTIETRSWCQEQQSGVTPIENFIDPKQKNFEKPLNRITLIPRRHCIPYKRLTWRIWHTRAVSSTRGTWGTLQTPHHRSSDSVPNDGYM